MLDVPGLLELAVVGSEVKNLVILKIRLKPVVFLNCETLFFKLIAFKKAMKNICLYFEL